MPDMKEAMRQAGLHPKDTRGDGPRGAPPSDNPFPAGYPQYFTKDGYPQVEMVKEQAETIARRFATERHPLTRHQLRAFYDHAKKQLRLLEYGTPFAKVHPEVARLKAFAADRAARDKIPFSFRQFIDRNIDAITDEKSFRNGFMPHFEAVVAYSARIRD